MKMFVLILFSVSFGALLINQYHHKAGLTGTTESSENQDCNLIQDGTDFMRCLLTEIERDISSSSHKFRSDAHSQHLKKKMLNSSGKPRLKAEYAYIRALLHGGKTQQSVVLLEEAIARENLEQEHKNALRSLLAISYLRLGEEMHCLDQPNPEVCIFPLSESDSYGWKDGSIKAMEIYQALLEENPGDLNSRWLLNLANITLNDESDRVPEELLIRSDYLGGPHSLQKFRNVAGQRMVAVNGLAGSSVIDDFNQDGWLDIITSSWHVGNQLKLFINDGQGSFTDQTHQANLEGITGGLNLLQADFNNDGCVDLLILRGAWLRDQGKHPNSLLQNDCNGMFSDVTRDAGLLSFHPTQTASWADFDRDGWIDLFIGNEKTISELFRNNGDGSFEEVGEEVNVVVDSFVKGADWGDIDNDGLPDLYVSVFNGKNLLFRNQGASSDGTWHFSEIADQAGVTDPAQSFPTAFLDFDNDGWLDILALPYSSYQQISLYKEVFGIPYDPEDPTIALFRNNSDGTFSNIAEHVQLKKSMAAMGMNHGDIDDDGFQDIYIGTGSPDFRSVFPNLMFRNQSGQSFENVTAAGDLGHIQKGHGISFGDFDNDGDQDIYAVMGGAFTGDRFQNALFENPGNENNSITLVLEGSMANRSGIGARITVTVREAGRQRNIHHEIGSGGSFGANPLRAEIGLGRAAIADRIAIRWPSESELQILEDLQANRVYRIREGESAIQSISR